MNIDFIKVVYGTSWGGGLNLPFRHLDEIISERFRNEKIAFPFELFEIQLGSLPEKKKEEAIRWYEKLPIYYRGKKMVRVTLPAAEEEKSLNDVFQFIYKAFDILATKKKKEDSFDPEKVKAVLLQLEKELQATDMPALHLKYENLRWEKAVEQRRQERLIREQANDEKQKLIYDLRFMYSFKDVGLLYFSPYDTRFCDRILEKLRARKFRLPHYTHLYISVSDTFDNALYHAVRAENWFVYGVVEYKKYADYPTLSEFEKKRVVFDLIRQGLHDIARIDKLDIETLNDALDEAEHDIFKRRKPVKDNPAQESQ